MNKLIDNKMLNFLLLITILGEFILPRILKHFYKGYNSNTMVMSALGSLESPVRRIYNAWLVWLGSYLLLISALMLKKVGSVSRPLAVLTFISIAVFAIGAGILSGLFSVNESKEKLTVASRIHGAGSAIGFMTLLFFPLLQCITSFKSDDIIQGIVCMLAFMAAMLFFVFFILGDKERFRKTFISYEGLWERLSLFFMYVPFLYSAITNII